MNLRLFSQNLVHGSVMMCLGQMSGFFPIDIVKTYPHNKLAFEEGRKLPEDVSHPGARSVHYAAPALPYLQHKL